MDKFLVKNIDKFLTPLEMVDTINALVEKCKELDTLYDDLERVHNNDVDVIHKSRCETIRLWKEIDILRKRVEELNVYVEKLQESNARLTQTNARIINGMGYGL